MANLTAVAALDAVYQLETTDPVLGGPGGISNLQPQQLLNRTQYILNRLNALLNAGGTKVEFAKVEGLGTAAGFNVGTAVNNILQTGAFGIGGDGKQSNNLDDLSSFWNGGFSVALAGASNAPSGETGYGMVIAFKATVPSIGVVLQQIAIYGSRIYFRQFITDTWTGWQWVTGSDDVGQVAAFAANVVPNSWIRANGATISRTQYAKLFARIGTTYGAGDGSTTFSVPDLRGKFIRGWDNAAGVDTGRVMGSSQDDDLKAHKHVLQTVIAGGGGVDGFTLAATTNGALGSISTTNIADFGATETRPKNVALLYCIKWQ